MNKVLSGLVAAAVAAGLLVTGAGATAGPAEAASSKVTWKSAKVIRWVDGDTVVTTKGTIRVIGVDTPEVGACGSDTATQLAAATAPPGSTVRLGNPRSVVNRDKYKRHLRYVVRKSTKVDISAMQIRNGAKARYDSLDGYQWHPRQKKYRTLDDAAADYQCAEPAPAPLPVVAPVQPVAEPTEPAPQPVANPYQERANLPVSVTNPDLDCGDIPTEYKPIHITGTDYHRLDADGDGWGCDI
jgi:endonuclease YncB( thermonuclease family)